MTGKFAVATFLALSFSLVIAQEPAAPTAPPAKRNMKPEDYKELEILGFSVISNDGKYLASQIRKIDGDGYLFIRRIDGPEKASVPFGARPLFSDSGKFLAYSIGVSKAEAEKNADQKRPSPVKMGLRNLESGQETVYEDFSQFSFLKGTEIVVAQRPRTKPNEGSDLVIFNANGGEQMVIPNVITWAPNESQTLLAIIISSGSGYSALQYLNPITGTLKSLYYGKSAVVALDWAKNTDTLVAAIEKPDEKKEASNHKIWRFSGIGTDGISRQELDPEKFEGFPKDMRINEGSGLSLSEDGSTVLFGIQPWKDRKKPGNPKETAGVEIWNTKDLRPIPQQKVEFGRDRLRGTPMIWNPGASKLISILPNGKSATDLTQIVVSRDHKFALIVDETPYATPVTNGISFSDVTAVNLKTGERNDVIKKNPFGGNLSDTGRFISYYENKKWFAYDIETKKAIALRPDGKYNFEDEDNDYTIEVKPPASFPIWLKDDSAVIVQDSFDAFIASPKSGTVVRLTQGREQNTRYRFQNPSREPEAPALSSTLYFRAQDLDTKKMGYYLSDGKGGGKMAIFDDVVVEGLVAAKNADRLMFVMESFLKCPDLYVTNLAFTAAKPVTKLNPTLGSQFNWGKAELVNYKSRFGVNLNGTLIYPAGFDPTKKYPMVTYIYERLSDEKNSFIFPAEWNAYDAQTLSQNGYFVFMPDIAYTGNRPGESALNCLEPAVDAAIKQEKAIDAKKVGLIGHSWGAYQTAFVTTVSDRFAAAACGAPLTELTSMYNSFYWNAGIADQVIFESSQGRMRVPFWEDPKAYLDNSPVWQASKRKIPIMMAFGDNDGAVDWHQGQYLYNTLRRMGKPCVLLVYAGENHNFRNRPNQLDYAKRMRHWLDVYLKGEKPEKWITDSIPFADQINK